MKPKKPARKKVKPVKAWCILFPGSHLKGTFATGVPFLYKTRAIARRELTASGRVIRVTITIED